VPGHMSVTLAAVNRQVLLHAYIAAQHHLRQVTFGDQQPDVPRPHVVSRIAVALVPDIVHAQVNIFACDAAETQRIQAFPEMADDDPVGRRPFLAQQRDLLQRQLAEMCRVGDDCETGSPLGAGRGPEHSLLGWSNPVALGPNLADYTCANVGPINSAGKLFDNEGGEGVRITLVNKAWIHNFAVPACAHYDVQACGFRDSPERCGVASQAAAGDIDYADPARGLVLGQLLNCNGLIIENSVVTAYEAPEVAKEMLVRECIAQVGRMNRAAN